jgi:hypothetical protein
MSAASRPTALAASPAAEPLPAAGAAAPRPTRTTVVRPQATPGSLSRGFVTDYGYIINELKRIFVLTAVILVVLLVLWFVLG